MTYQTLKNDFRGVNVVTATPFTESGTSVRLDAIETNASRLLAAGMRVFIACGGVSEYYSLSTDERVDVVEATVRAVGDEATVVGGVGGSSKHAVDLASRYEDVGADAIMILFPDRPTPHRDGLVPYYERIIRSTDLGVMLYKSDPRLDTETIDELAAHENVVAVKHAVENIGSFVTDVNDVDPELAWIDGNAEVGAVATGLEGADGFTTGIGNFVPELSLELMDAIREERWKRARTVRELARPFQELRSQAPGSTDVGVVKHGMDVAGYYGGPVRAPQASMDDDRRDRVERLYERVRADLPKVDK